MKMAIILLGFCFIIGVSFYALENPKAQVLNQPPAAKTSSTAEPQTISVDGKSGAIANLESKTIKSAAETQPDNLPPSRFYSNIRPSPEKTIKLPVLAENEKWQSPQEKRLRIGTVREFEKPITKISDGSIFPVVGGSVWILKIVSEKALRIRLRFTESDLPPKAKIFVYPSANSDEIYLYEQTAGAENKEFWTPSFDGDSLVIEYFMPETNPVPENSLPFQISQTGHIYKNPLANSESNSFDPPDQPCHLNVPSNLTDLAKSVGHLQFVDRGSIFVCTGTLLNNVTGDFEPLLLTANHCISSQTVAQSLEVFWNYNIGDFPFPPAIRSSQSVLLSTNTASDFTLVRILGALPIRENHVFWSGWTTTDPPIGTSVFGIHHPSGSYKRFSSGSTISFCLSGLPCQNTIGVRWAQGTTEGGSSGSGLWNTNSGQLTGALSGGETGCGIRDGYGKFSTTFSFISPFMQGGSDDNFDAGNGNDTRANAAVVQAGAFSNLIVKWQDEDWYRISLPNNGTLSVTVNFTHSYGNIDLNLFRGNEANPTAISNSSSNTETITYTNTSGTTETLSLRVFLFDGVRNSYNMNVTAPPSNPSVTGKLFDYDGDGKADISIFRPSDSNWLILQSSNVAVSGLGFGLSSDLIAPADFDGDGRSDIAVFRPSNGTWFLQQSTSGFTGIQFGQTGDIPMPADYDGDGRADIAVVRQTGGASVWYILGSSQGFFGVQFGTDTDKIVPADFDGDGKTDIAVFRPSNGVWYLLRSQMGFTATAFGTAEDIPAAADFDGDGRADIAVFRPSNGVWYLLQSSSGFTAVQFGLTSDIPTPSAFRR